MPEPTLIDPHVVTLTFNLASRPFFFFSDFHFSLMSLQFSFLWVKTAAGPQWKPNAHCSTTGSKSQRAAQWDEAWRARCAAGRKGVSEGMLAAGCSAAGQWQPLLQPWCPCGHRDPRGKLSPGLHQQHCVESKSPSLTMRTVSTLVTQKPQEDSREEENECWVGKPDASA